jgi:iron complex outermembrane receptor protein
MTLHIGRWGALLAVGAVSSFPALAAAQEPPASAPSDASPAAPARDPRGDVRPPQVVDRVDAIYPESAKKDRRHADVLTNVTVDTQGNVTKVDVVESGGADMDDAAIAAVRRWTFHPALRGGQPVASRIRVPFHFAPPVEPTSPGGDASRASVVPAVNPTPIVTPVPAPATPAPSAAPTVEPSPKSDVEDVNIYGKLTRRSQGASDYQITVGQLAAVPRTNASDALKLAPGFLLTNEGGSGHAEQVFLRGFDAHEGQDLEFTVDGVPINDPGNYHGNGYADTHFIIPELIHAVRVLEGPYAPQQGNFAVAGSADYQLGLDRRGLTAQYEYGSFNSQRLLLLYGPKDSPSGTFAGAEYYTTDGFGTNRQAQRGTAIGQYEIPLSSKSVLRLNATVYYTAYSSAGIVREDDVQHGFVGFYGTEDPNQNGNDASRVSVSATYERKGNDIDVSQQVFFINRTMRLRENDTGFLEDTQAATQELHDQRGDLIDLWFTEQTEGMRGLARWHGQALGLKQEFEGGYYARVDETTSQQYRIAAGSNAPYATDADYTSTLGDIAVYADANVHFLPWLGLRGGLRADMFLFDVLNNCANQSVGSSPNSAVPDVDISCQSQGENGTYREPFLRNSTATGTVMPRGTLVVGPLQHFELTVSAGNGVRTVDPSYVGQANQTPFVSAESQDFGLAYTRDIGDSVSLVAKSVFFHTHVDQDLVFNPTLGRSTLSTGSERTGWSWFVRAKGNFFDLNANATTVRAVFDDSGSCQPNCGLLVPYVPDIVLRADLALFHDLPWKIDHKRIQGLIGYGVSYVGPRALPYGEFSNTIFLSDASISAGWSIFNLRLVGQNLFNSEYKLGEYNYASYFPHPGGYPEPTLAPQRSFTAGAPRMLTLVLSVTLGGA